MRNALDADSTLVFNAGKSDRSASKLMRSADGRAVLQDAKTGAPSGEPPACSTCNNKPPIESLIRYNHKSQKSEHVLARVLSRPLASLCLRLKYVLQPN